VALRPGAEFSLLLIAALSLGGTIAPAVAHSLLHEAEASHAHGHGGQPHKHKHRNDGHHKVADDLPPAACRVQSLARIAPAQNLPPPPPARAPVAFAKDAQDARPVELGTGPPAFVVMPAFSPSVANRPPPADPAA
jgi:hypothetical protein